MKGKHILITGAASGYGAALSLACGQAGATVVLLDKSIKSLEKQYDKLIEAGAPEPAIMAVNLAGADAEAFATIEQAISQLPQLDAMVLNAADFGGLTPMRNFVPEKWYRTMQINLNSNFHLLQALLPLLEQTGDGRIVYVHDQVGDSHAANWGAYGVSKAAMKALIEILANEHINNPKLQFSTITPAPMRTALRQRTSPAGTIEGMTPESQVSLVLDALWPSSAS